MIPKSDVGCAVAQATNVENPKSASESILGCAVAQATSLEGCGRAQWFKEEIDKE